MASMSRRQLLAGTGAAVFAGAVGGVAAGDVGWLSDLGSGNAGSTHDTPRSLIQRRHLPNVPLLTHEGEPVRFYDDLVRDKKVLLNFVDMGNRREAGLVTSNLREVRGLLGTRVGRDVFMYSIALDPAKATPPVLARWSREHRTGPGWLFLTGHADDVTALRRAAGFAYDDPTEDRDPASIASVLKFGNEPEMRWAHCATRAHPRQIARMVVADFGPDPRDPNPPPWYCTLKSLPQASSQVG
jgi:protein SCO1